LRAQPSAVLDEMVRVLDIPPQIQPLLAGEQPTAVPGLECVPARGFAAGMRASWRGEFDAPDKGVQGQRPLAWQRHRPGGYRLINGLLVLPQAALAWWFAQRADGDWTSWWALLTAVAGLGAVSSLWDTRPAPKPET